MPRKRWLYNLATALMFGSVLHYFLFFFIAWVLGGTTWNGKVEGDRYYLALKGNYTEVPPGMWTYMRVHGMCVIGTLALFPIGFAYMMFYEKRQPAAG